MPGPLQARLSWDDLWAYARARGITTMTGLVRASGADVRNLHRWRAAGGVPERAADRVAVALGVTPDLLWGEQWRRLGEEAVERETQRKRALRAAKMRRYRARHPDYAERQRTAARAYKADCRDYVLAYNREYNRSWRERRREVLLHVAPIEPLLTGPVQGSKQEDPLPGPHVTGLTIEGAA